MLTYTQEDMVMKLTSAMLANEAYTQSTYEAIVEDAFNVAKLVDEKLKDPEAFTKKYFESEAS
jgi:hypothetical protein